MTHPDPPRPTPVGAPGTHPDPPYRGRGGSPHSDGVGAAPGNSGWVEWPVRDTPRDGLQVRARCCLCSRPGTQRLVRGSVTWLACTDHAHVLADRWRCAVGHWHRPPEEDHCPGRLGPGGVDARHGWPPEPEPYRGIDF